MYFVLSCIRSSTHKPSLLDVSSHGDKIRAQENWLGPSVFVMVFPTPVTLVRYIYIYNMDLKKSLI